MTDAEIDEIALAMPQGIEGFLKHWGYQQFAREIIEAHEAKADEKRKMRAKFEAWAQPLLGDSSDLRESALRERAWEAWQAASKSLEG